MRILSTIGVAALALIILVTPVLAHHRDGHNGGPPSAVQNNSNNNKDRDNDNDNEAESNRFGAESADDCAEDARNHGQYVSCVAHLVQAEGEGDIEAEDIDLDEDCDDFGSLVACAAHSDVGKDESGGARASSSDGDNDNGDNED